MITEKKERYNVNVRFSKKEMQEIKSASAEQMLSMSAYVRRSIFLKASAVKQ
jgi:predicted DNA binding CopG/RHH family protein